MQQPWPLKHDVNKKCKLLDFNKAKDLFLIFLSFTLFFQSLAALRLGFAELILADIKQGKKN